MKVDELLKYLGVISNTIFSLFSGVISNFIWKLLKTITVFFLGSSFSKNKVHHTMFNDVFPEEYKAAQQMQENEESLISNQFSFIF